MGRKVTTMHLDAVEDHFQRARSLGHRAVYFDIETAFRDWGRMERILEMASDYGLQSGLNTRIDTARPDRIRRAAELGAVYTFFGVENLDPQVLMAIDKFAQGNLQMRANSAVGYAQKVEDSFRWMNESGVQSSLFLIMGLPKIDDASWASVQKSETKSIQDLNFVQTTFEDDESVIREAFRRCNPYHFNANILRLNPDTAMAWQKRFACIRPSGEDPIDAVWFVPRVARNLGLPKQDFHSIYRFFEGVETDQPFSTAIDPDRAYKTAQVILEEANKYGSHVYFDEAIKESGLITGDPRDQGYRIAPLKDFEQLE
jgi:anaerobic magnesium-protoporphyrin IX monomethyl ester cyclase